MVITSSDKTAQVDRLILSQSACLIFLVSTWLLRHVDDPSIDWSIVPETSRNLQNIWFQMKQRSLQHEQSSRRKELNDRRRGGGDSDAVPRHAAPLHPPLHPSTSLMNVLQIKYQLSHRAEAEGFWPRVAVFLLSVLGQIENSSCIVWESVKKDLKKLRVCEEQLRSRMKN